MIRDGRVFMLILKGNFTEDQLREFLALWQFIIHEHQQIVDILQAVDAN